MLPVMTNDRLAVWTSRITGKQKPCMCIRKHFAVETLVEPRFIKNSRLEIFGVRRYVGFPTETRNHGQVGSSLPGVLDIRAEIAFAGVPPDKRLLLELRRPS